MKRYAAVGLTVLAGAALFEAALIPGVVIGGAAMLAPRLWPLLRRQARAQSPKSSLAHIQSASVSPAKRDDGTTMHIGQLAIGQALAKTVSYRVIVTALDFTTNYVVIGEFAAAAGLSSFNLVAGPLFYFAHETAWNYWQPSHPSSDLHIDLPLGTEAGARGKGLTISRALAKTITFRTIATVMDFTTNYVVVRDAATAAILSASGFILGPFVYLGHEKLWDYYTASQQQTTDPPSLASMRLLPAPSTAARV